MGELIKMNLKFFGEWYDKKYPPKNDKYPRYQISDKLWAELCDDDKSKIITESKESRITGISAGFWILSLISIFVIFRTCRSSKYTRCFWNRSRSTFNPASISHQDKVYLPLLMVQTGTLLDRSTRRRISLPRWSRQQPGSKLDQIRPRRPARFLRFSNSWAVPAPTPRRPA